MATAGMHRKKYRDVLARKCPLAVVLNLDNERSDRLTTICAFDDAWRVPGAAVTSDNVSPIHLRGIEIII